MTTKPLHAKLSDGRDLFYFDDPGSELPPTRKTDTRPAMERPPAAQMRLDSLTGEWISVAAARQNRAFLPPAHECPLCPTTDTNLSELPDIFDVAVFENKSPSFGPTLLEHDDLEFAVVPNLELGSVREAVGRCEVVIFSPEHTGSLASQSTTRVRTIIDAWTHRTEHLQALSGVRQVFPFENRGQEIGVTLHHPHGQIYAYPYVTPRTTKLLESIEKFGADLHAQTLAFEQAGQRVVLASDNFTAYVPFAARWPLEVHLLPHRHVSSFVELTDDERDELASVYHRLLRCWDNLYDTPTPYISAWHQAPLVAGGENVRLQLQLTSPRRSADKLKYLAGSESAMGAFIGDVPPETTAGLIREALEQ
jgi:UDPglucose--hexose-1-phosphate uridylyltransferase